MTPDARASLVEVMARGLADLYCWDWSVITEDGKSLYRCMAEAAIAAAERAGFKWEDSRG